MTDLVVSIFSTHHPNWTDIQAPLNSLLTGDEWRLVLDKTNEEAQRLCQENPDGALGSPKAIPLTEPSWDPNGDGLPFLEHCKRCILEGMRKGVPEQKSLNMVQEVQQKSTEDPS